MKKTTLLFFGLISTFGFSQQVVKRITDTPTQTIVELFVLRNGTSLPNTTGESNFNSGTSDNSGNVIIYNPSINSTYSKSASNFLYLTHNNEQIGNGSFVFFTDNLSKEQTNFIATNGSGTTLPLIIPQEDGNADSTQDSNSITDLLYTKFYLPKTLTDGNSIPTGLVAKCSSRLGKDLASGATMPSQKSVLFTFNGTTWVSSSIDWLGFIMPTIQEIDNNGQLLNINEFINNSKITIYPNPTNNFITIQNKQNTIENFEYKIIDLTGRIVRSGNSKFNDQINVESLESGNYIIQIETENDKKLTEKLIKN
jgi:hypothetical protein